MTENYKYPASTFEANPTVNSLFVFPDGNCFIKKNDADTYAKTSKREYQIIERQGEQAEETNEETQTETNTKQSKNKKSK